VFSDQKDYENFLERLGAVAAGFPAEEAKAQSILGHDRFLDRIRRILRSRDKIDCESEAARRQLTAESVEAIVNRVARI
jgi:hypothetical protein